MWIRLRVLLSCCLLTACANAQEPKTELADLQGSWLIVSITEDGEPVADENVNGYKFLFKERNLVMADPDGKKLDEFEIVVAPMQKPMLIDLVPVAKDRNKRLGIFELREDSLRICLAWPGSAERPTAFKSESGSFESLITLKRIKQ